MTFNLKDGKTYKGGFEYDEYIIIKNNTDYVTVNAFDGAKKIKITADTFMVVEPLSLGSGSINIYSGSQEGRVSYTKKHLDSLEKLISIFNDNGLFAQMNNCAEDKIGGSTSEGLAKINDDFTIKIVHSAELTTIPFDQIKQVSIQKNLLQYIVYFETRDDKKYRIWVWKANFKKYKNSFINNLKKNGIAVIEN